MLATECTDEGNRYYVTSGDFQVRRSQIDLHSGRVTEDESTITETIRFLLTRRTCLHEEKKDRDMELNEYQQEKPERLICCLFLYDNQLDKSNYQRLVNVNSVPGGRRPGSGMKSSFHHVQNRHGLSARKNKMTGADTEYPLTRDSRRRTAEEAPGRG